MSEKTYSTKVPLYGTSLRLTVSNDVPSYFKANTKEDGNPLAFTAWIKGVITVVIAPDTTVGVIAHEVVHAAAEVLDHHGAKWGASNQEPLCYLVNWIADWICRVGGAGPKNVQKKCSKY